MQVKAVTTWVRTPLLLLAVVEFAALYSSFYVAGLICIGTIYACEQVNGLFDPRAILFAGLTLVSFIAMGLYQFNQRFYFRQAVLRVLVGLVFSSAASGVVFSFIPGLEVSGPQFALVFGYSLALLVAIRFYFFRTVDENLFRRRTIVFGAGERAASLMDLRRRADRRGFKIVGRIAAPGDSVIGDRSEVLFTNGKSLTDLAKERDADEIVIAMDERRGNLPVKELLDARLSGINVIDILEFFERESGKIRIDLVNPGWLIFSPGFRISRLRHYVQRSVDLMVSLAIIAVSWPIMLLIALSIKCEEGMNAPIFYYQSRVGALGKIFDVRKFRSMRVNAEADGKAVWAKKDDDRVTRVGKILRTLRLDELPQVFNVLRGEMSLVGPRPERPEFVEKLKCDIPYYDERHAVKPGITGWAQLNYSYGASVEDAAEKLMYDLYYIKNQSLIVDLLIILQTVEVVIWGKGAR